MKTQELLLKTAFCCMACDGEIAKEEIATIKNMAKQTTYFADLNVSSKINSYVHEISTKKSQYLSEFLAEVGEAQLTIPEQLQIIRIALETIEADKNIEYSEIYYFKKIREKLSITDEEILKVMPDKEEYLLPDVKETDDILWNINFDDLKISL